jgi:hypothetical protein
MHAEVPAIQVQSARALRSSLAYSRDEPLVNGLTPPYVLS